MQHLTIGCHGTGRYAAAIVAISMSISFAELSSASSCDPSADVTLGGMPASDCGWATSDNIANTPVNDPQQPNDYMGWDVNLNSDGGRNDWQFYYKQDLGLDGLGNPVISPDYSAGAAGIDLQITSFSGGDDGYQTGTFTVNASDPILIVLGDGEGTDYHWYRFDGKTGPQTGTWDTKDVFGGADLSNITAYVVPIPAAVWLFGSGLVCLAGMARRRRSRR